ncbi:hypothetical protein [Streptomyces sp. NPDC048191]|uniref:hypothetical protein n=1 Tax=Streptomyces sp. NPDC048191 TaxID=3155484 RepID=UPI00340436BC
MLGRTAPGHQRLCHKHWVDADKDGCNTRAEVLKAKAVIAPEQGPNCTLTGGEWYSPYGDRYIQGPRGLDIDHLVPLAEAGDSDASIWTAREREEYANVRWRTAVASRRCQAHRSPMAPLPY